MAKVYNTDKDKVVGFKKEAEIMIDKLIHGPKERDVVLITGMGGLGKTTLARRVYDEKKVDNYFDNRAWCTISQEYDCNVVLHKIYSQVWDSSKTNQVWDSSKTKIKNVAEKLRKSLMGKRYLIVLDDIWSVEAWEELNRVFPSCDNGSRIVLTSRQENLVSDAKYICLPFFTIDESWALLKLKLFKGKKCLKNLENVGREISKKCGGLPLVVGLVAGLLERVEKGEQMWRGFLNSLNSRDAFRDGIRSNDAIELSYKHLSHHLKPCLLYFAAFPEDKVIEVSYLIKLWISEGFIDIIKKERVEDEAEDYLNYLVCSNLIMVSESKYDGRILSCVVHDLVRDFCLSKAKEENFFQIINLENKFDPAQNFTPHRICFHRYGGHHEIPYELAPWNSSTRTLLGYEIFSRNSHIYNIGSWIAKNFDHLTVLDFEFINVDKSILSQVNLLIHLRYLALRLHGYGFVSPLSLGNLERLITLKLTSNWHVHLPNFFWNMRSLRHMIIYHYCISCTKEPCQAISVSEVLQTLESSISLSIRDEHFLKKLPHLKYLSCLVSPTYLFPEISFLNHLESLKISNRPGYPHLLNDLKLRKFPASIKEINLFGITLSLSAVSIFAELSNLEALILQECKFEGLEWNVEEETQFCKLKYLELNDLDIRIWNISRSESFPCLEQLIVRKCWSLRDMPFSLADILTLKVISVKYCKSRTESSVKKIQEDARDIGNEQLNVEISDYQSRWVYSSEEEGEKEEEEDDGGGGGEPSEKEEEEDDDDGGEPSDEEEGEDDNDGGEPSEEEEEDEDEDEDDDDDYDDDDEDKDDDDEYYTLPLQNFSLTNQPGPHIETN